MLIMQNSISSYYQRQANTHFYYTRNALLNFLHSYISQINQVNLGNKYPPYRPLQHAFGALQLINMIKILPKDFISCNPTTISAFSENIHISFCSNPQRVIVIVMEKEGIKIERGEYPKVFLYSKIFDAVKYLILEINK